MVYQYCNGIEYVQVQFLDLQKNTQHMKSDY